MSHSSWKEFRWIQHFLSGSISYDNSALACLLTQLSVHWSGCYWVLDKNLCSLGRGIAVSCLRFSPLVWHRERGIWGRDESVSEDALRHTMVNCCLDIKEGHWIGWERHPLHFWMVLLCLRACRVGTNVPLCLMGGDWQWASEAWQGALMQVCTEKALSTGHETW